MHMFENHELGRTDELIRIETSKENRHAIEIMAQQCHRSIEIISRSLDPKIYDTVKFLDFVKKMILDNRRAKVRLLVFEPKTIVQKGHRLMNLAMTLSSFIEFRIPGEDFKDFNESLFLADTTGYIHRPNEDRFEGTLNFYDKLTSKHLLEKFEQIWEKSSPDPNLRKLNI